MKHFAIGWALARFYFRLIPNDWYRTVPFLPIPPAGYVQWRLKTAYGKHHPGWIPLMRDVWQFGDWLRTFDKN